ncbi:MAG TPA: hypothetical protein DIS74_08090, partial [Bacteroidales bacterium]|nr:hypothetical protein [Bacteroidales bacterium]
VNESNAVTKMIRQYSRGTWRIIPGDGTCVGNYVLVDDVAKGHILAAMHGTPGERYLLGGENLTFDQFFETLARLTGRRRRMIRLPVSYMITGARIMEWQTSFTGIPPLITAPWVKKYLNHWNVSCAKASDNLGYQPVSFAEGAKLTLEWLAATGQLR